MSYVVQVGNLVKTPELRFTTEGRPYALVRVAVNSRAKDDAGTWVNVGTTFYSLIVGGDQALKITEMAQESGNVRVLFAGSLTTREYTRKDGGIGLSHDVRVEEIGASLRGQNITIQTHAHTDEDMSWPN